MKQNSVPNEMPSRKAKKEYDVMDAINAAKESVDRNVRPRTGINQPGLKKLSKKTPSTSSGGSSTKGNDIKAKNFYE